MMAVSRKKIEGNLTRIREQISAACARRGRSDGEVSIVAVTKSVDVDTIRALVETGLLDVGDVFGFGGGPGQAEAREIERRFVVFDVVGHFLVIQVGMLFENLSNIDGHG